MWKKTILQLTKNFLSNMVRLLSTCGQSSRNEKGKRTSSQWRTIWRTTKFEELSPCSTGGLRLSNVVNHDWKPIGVDTSQCTHIYTLELTKNILEEKLKKYYFHINELSRVFIFLFVVKSYIQVLGWNGSNQRTFLECHCKYIYAKECSKELNSLSFLRSNHIIPFLTLVHISSLIFREYLWPSLTYVMCA